MDLLLPEPQPVRFQGAPGGRIKAGPEVLFVPAALTPLDELSLTRLHSAGFKKASHLELF